MITRINLDATKMNSEERALKLEEVATQLHQILNSTMFRDLVLKMRKTGERSKWKDATNSEIYNRIMSGADRYSDVEDNVLDIFVDDYYTFKKVIGYTKASSKYIYVNTKFFDGRSNKKVGSNILHEYGHLVGFSHDFRSTADMPNSICYLLNDIYERCHELLIGQRIPSLVKVKVSGYWFWSRYEWRRQ